MRDTDDADRRLVLANERTLLSYARTSLAAVALAVFVLVFVPTALGITLSLAMLAIAGALLYVGIRGFRAIARNMPPHAAFRSPDLEE